MRISDVGEFEFIIRPALCARCELNQNTKHSNLQIILFGSFLNEISWDRKKKKRFHSKKCLFRCSNEKLWLVWTTMCCFYLINRLQSNERSTSCFTIRSPGSRWKQPRQHACWEPVFRRCRLRNGKNGEYHNFMTLCWFAAKVIAFDGDHFSRISQFVWLSLYDDVRCLRQSERNIKRPSEHVEEIKLETRLMFGSFAG